MNENGKRQIKISLKDKLILGGLSSIIFPFIIVGLIIYTQLSGALLEMSEEKALHMARDVSTSIDEILKRETKLASSIAADPDIVKAMVNEDYRAVQIKMGRIYERIGKNYFTLFITDKNGISRADAFFKRQIGLDLSDRDYFIKAKQGNAGVAGPLRAKSRDAMESPIIIVFAPIMDESEFYGIIGIPFSADFLVGLLSRHKIGRTGYAFLIDDEGIVLAHPKREFILNLRLFDHPDTEEIRNNVINKKNKIASYSFEGNEKIAGLSRMIVTNWTAAFTQNKNEIMSPVNKIIYSIFISGLIFLTITMLIIVFLSRRLSTPIQKMMEVRKQVTRHSTEIILQIGLDRKILFANPAFEKITELKADTVIGTEPCLDNPSKLSPEAIWDILESGDSWSGRVILKGNRPDFATLDVMLVPLRDDHGSIHGYLLIGRDITTELLHENRLQQAQKLEAIGTLAGGIAHDFNNILSAIFGYAELALMENESVADTGKYIKQIKIASERARDLVSQILTFSRKNDVELRPLIPKTVLKEATKLLRASIPAKIDIQVKMASDSMIMAEPTQLHQIVMNLFMNAAHAIGNNTGRINLDLEDFFVDEEFTKTHPNIKKGKHVRIRVSDTGGGIEQKILDQIFEPFFTTKSHGHGTGLGLSVVHGIVRKLQGIVTVYTEIDKGTVFNIIIPCTQTDSTNWPEDKAPIQKGSEKIVIIDDEESIAITQQAILKNIGYDVIYFTDSLEALTTIEQHPEDIDIIITDYSMPKLTGLELAEKLTAMGIIIPTILTSGFLEKNIEERARKLGIKALVTKPINSYQITDAIRRIMDKTT